MDRLSAHLHSTSGSRLGIKKERAIHDESETAEPTLSGLLSLCLRAGDELLWAEFIRRSQPLIAGTVIKALRRFARHTPNIVDDLVQETYLKLFAAKASALRRFVCHHENALYGFLKVVTANTVQDHVRRFNSVKRGGDWEGDTRSTVLEWTRIVVQQNRHMEHHIIIREIDAHLKQRGIAPGLVRDYTIFWLYYREGLTAQSISCIPSIGLTVKGVESSLLRVTRFVRLKMRQGRHQTASALAVAAPRQFLKTSLEESQ
ncbi:MAG TPA: sigma-70 family RNA polymerase sigma factor [Candidatus Angelobacter sp.]|nr:sigma-70 family RNA polymerase sigma factor [Candidatus Angelobacter sp.]